LYSSDVASFASKNLCARRHQLGAPYRRHRISGNAQADVHLQQLAAVDGDPRPLADDLGREDEVLEQLGVHVRERARTRALLLDARVARRLGQHPALADEHDVSLRELLLEFAGKAGRRRQRLFRVSGAVIE
jgi:hypothetical protein